MSSLPPLRAATPAVISMPKDRAALGITALCLGIRAVVTGAGMNVLACMGLGGAALVTGAIARNGSKRKMAIWGLILGVIGIACGSYGFVKVQQAVDALQQHISY